MSYRDDVEALAARHAALAAEVTQGTRERDAARDELRRAKLPVLDDVRVAAPCPADWAAMTGDDRVRACSQCDRRVYNLSAMTRVEAEALITQHEGRLCVRYFRRRDGTILTRDCGVGVARRRRRRLVVAGAAVGLAGAVLALRPRAHEEHTTAIDIELREAPTVGTIAHEPPPPPIVHRDPPHHDQLRTRIDRGEWIMGRK